MRCDKQVLHDDSPILLTHYSLPVVHTNEKIDIAITAPPPRGKRDGIIRHILERENGNRMTKLRYCVNYQSVIQRG